MSHYEQLWLIAFIKTQLIEVITGIVILLIYSRYKRKKYSDILKYGAVIFIASAITHPLLWFVFPKWKRQLGISYKEYVLYGELLIFMIEGLWYMMMLKPVQRRVFSALALSLFLNSFSYLAGVYLW